MKFFYPARIQKEADGSYKAVFPDLYMCEAKGRSYEEVLENAKEAERNWIQLELEEDEELPRKSEPEEIRLKEDDIVQNVSVTIRLMEGYDE